MYDPDQFRNNERLFKATEMIDEEHSPLHDRILDHQVKERMQSFIAEKDRRAQSLTQVTSTVTTPMPPPAPKPARHQPRLSLRVESDRSLSIGHLPKPNKVKD
jgi:hypothetical protein